MAVFLIPLPVKLCVVFHVAGACVGAGVSVGAACVGCDVIGVFPAIAVAPRSGACVACGCVAVVFEAWLETIAFKMFPQMIRATMIPTVSTTQNNGPLFLRGGGAGGIGGGGYVGG